MLWSFFYVVQEIFLKISSSNIGIFAFFLLFVIFIRMCLVYLTCISFYSIRSLIYITVMVCEWLMAVFSVSFWIEGKKFGIGGNPISARGLGDRLRPPAGPGRSPGGGGGQSPPAENKKKIIIFEGTFPASKAIKV